MLTLLQGAPQVTAAFLGSAVEAVEAVTIVLAVGVVRGWRSALAGAGAGLATLVLIVALFGPAIASIPISYLRIIVGTLLLLFGIRWMRKAILRSAAFIALHDEGTIYAVETEALRVDSRSTDRLDTVAVLAAYKAVILEGIEVVVIVVGIGTVGDILWPASLSALAACALVALAGALLQRPLARVPENLLKHLVGVMMSAFGLFWFGEGAGIDWPYSDLAILALMFVLATASFLGTLTARAVGGTIAAKR